MIRFPNYLKCVIGLLCLTATSFAAPQSGNVIQRYMLVAGANDGGPQRAVLRYAHTDAEAFARVMNDMGGIPQSSQVKLLEPKLEEFKKGFARLGNILRNDFVPGSRQEVMIYYSGHANEQGLLLGKQVMSWKALREQVDALPASVKITVLDACGSGAIMRTKGGQRRQAFLLDASTDMTGYAFLTSSSEDEVSQESDRIKGSFFTHSLVSGLRGGADVTGDGKVTLSEAYQFAFNETLTRTQGTTGGAQHPTRDMKLSGTGDVVMTDLRVTSAGVVLGEALHGRIFIRGADRQLVAELHKPYGREVEIGLPPGRYSVQMEQSTLFEVPQMDLSEGKRHNLAPADFKVISRERTAWRGEKAPDERSMILDSLSRTPRKKSFDFFYNRQDNPWRGNMLSVFANEAKHELVGLQATAGVNIVHSDMDGMQIGGLANMAFGNVEQGQISGWLNLADNTPLQLNGGLNMADTIDGIQGGFVNLARGSLDGIQGGFVNVATGPLDGVQGGFVNIASDSLNGIQGGFVNVSVLGDANVQGGFVNVAQNVGSFQGGFVNVADNVDKFQFGFINVADSVGIASIGFLSFVGNGLLQFTSQTDELGWAHFGILTGTPWLYTGLSMGNRLGDFANRNTADPVAVSVTLGTQWGTRGPAWINTEFTQAQFWPNSEMEHEQEGNMERNLHQWKLAVGSGVRVLPGVALVGGISQSLVTPHGGEPNWLMPRGKWHADLGYRDWRTFTGFHAGIRVGKI